MPKQDKAVLVTGAAGMIGCYLTDRILQHTDWRIVGIDTKDRKNENPKYRHYQIDLADREGLTELFEAHEIVRIIHLAALAHTAGESDLSFDRYYHVNVHCAEVIFRLAAERKIPVLFISTVDVLGFVKGVVTPSTPPDPVSNYGRSKAMAERLVKEICPSYDIYRLSPVYTENIKRDIQKRYYLKTPNWAYRIGRGNKFEVLDVRRAVEAMSEWTRREPTNAVRIIKDWALLDVNDLIRAEKAEGRARHVVRLPRWLVVSGYLTMRALFGKTNKTYLIHKALWPFRTTDEDEHAVR